MITTGEHVHQPRAEEASRATRSLFTKAQLAEARTYMKETRNGEGCAAHLVGRRFEEAELPSITQLSGWMHNERKQQPKSCRSGSASQ